MELSFGEIVKKATSRVMYAYEHNNELTIDFVNGAKYALDNYLCKADDGLPSSSDGGDAFAMYKRGEISEMFFDGLRFFQECLHDECCCVRGTKSGLHVCD